MPLLGTREGGPFVFVARGKLETHRRVVGLFFSSRSLGEKKTSPKKDPWQKNLETL